MFCTIFNWHNLVVPSADFQANLSWRYLQIVSIEDQAKHCFKNERLKQLIFHFIWNHLFPKNTLISYFVQFLQPFVVTYPSHLLWSARPESINHWFHLLSNRQSYNLFLINTLNFPSFNLWVAKLGKPNNKIIIQKNSIA